MQIVLRDVCGAIMKQTCALHVNVLTDEKALWVFLGLSLYCDALGLRGRHLDTRRAWWPGWAWAVPEGLWEAPLSLPIPLMTGPAPLRKGRVGAPHLALLQLPGSSAPSQPGPPWLSVGKGIGVQGGEPLPGAHSLEHSLAAGLRCPWVPGTTS